MHAVDWFPTIAELVGYRPSSDLAWDGVSQWPALTGVGPPPANRSIYIAANNGQALFHGDWKLIAKNKGEPELFNLAKDPYEKEDLAAKEPERLAELQNLLAEQHAKDRPDRPADLKGQAE